MTLYLKVVCLLIITNSLFAQDTLLHEKVKGKLYIGIEGGSSLAPSRFDSKILYHPAFRTTADFGGYISILNIYYQFRERLMLQTGLHFVNIGTRLLLPDPSFTYPERAYNSTTGSADEYVYPLRLHWIAVKEKPEVTCCKIRKRTQLSLFAGIAFRRMRDKFVPVDGMIPSNPAAYSEYFGSTYTKLADFNLNIQIGTTLFFRIRQKWKAHINFMYNRGLSPIYRWYYEYKVNNIIYKNTITGYGHFYSINGGISYLIFKGSRKK